MVYEKSWNIKSWQKIIEFCYQSSNYNNFAHKMYQIRLFLATTKKSSIDVESQHFPTFSVKCCECKIMQRDGHGKLINCHGKVDIFYAVKICIKLKRIKYQSIVEYQISQVNLVGKTNLAYTPPPPFPQFKKQRNEDMKYN